MNDYIKYAAIITSNSSQPHFKLVKALCANSEAAFKLIKNGIVLDFERFAVKAFIPSSKLTVCYAINAPSSTTMPIVALENLDATNAAKTTLVGNALVLKTVRTAYILIAYILNLPLNVLVATVNIRKPMPSVLLIKKPLSNNILKSLNHLRLTE